MSSPHNVELEAAKFLHKLIQDSEDEPARLATKLYVILQHMKASGKEHSMPYQVISRAMETVVNQHGLDIEALMSSRVPLASGSQVGNSSTTQYAGSSQTPETARDPKPSIGKSEMQNIDSLASGRPPTGTSGAVQCSSGAAHGFYQGSGIQRSSQSFDHESPSSLDTRSANSQSQERGETMNKKAGKKSTTKRKRGESSSLSLEPHGDSPQQHDTGYPVPNRSKGKLYKAEPGGVFTGKGGEATNFNMVPSSGQMQHFSPMAGMQQLASASASPGTFGKNHGGMSLTPQMFQANRGDFSTGKVLDHTNMPVQGMRQNSHSDMTMIRPPAPGLSPSQAPSYSSILFNEQQLKQLRAQCLVFLAFRNGVMPKKFHLEIALGIPNDDARGELVDHKGKTQSSLEPGSSSDVLVPRDKNPPSGRIHDTESLIKDEKKPKLGDRSSSPSELPSFADEKKYSLASRNLVSAASDGNHADETDNAPQGGRVDKASSMTGINKNSVLVGFPGMGSRKDLSRGSAATSTGQHDFASERNDSGASRFHTLGTIAVPSNQPAISNSPSANGTHSRPVSFYDNSHQTVTPMNGASMTMKHVPQDETNISESQPICFSDGFNAITADASTTKRDIYYSEHSKVDELMPTDTLPSPRHTLTEKWILDQQKKKLMVQQNWVQKQQKTNEKIVARFNKLKESVSSSEDISTKTKSVIELKKLQLLELQRRLRSELLNDFFKPVATDMERLKSYKKHKHGRRIKQIEKYEQKMKEERQKRIRERQKEFFSEIEVHREKLDDVFKIRRERWKGFNKSVKEFHKRKERVHREKFDRIQREKINLLKINDVEGYLRMVQDAKSDRVKQLLKETEKYLQKLGSKLRDAKATETRSTNILEVNEDAIENEDENDQAKHYMESNEKYYLMAHSIKENVAEQPNSLIGGKLREYQMNGLRWLVSLYNNHLNGILADEMGLGKTVQVISLICYLMESKHDRGPFLVVVPSSVLPGWVSELTFWAPGIHTIVYSGPPDERRRLFKEQILHQKFNVLLTTYEYLMNKHDRPKLSKIQWHYIIIDEGHRIKNASCKLNADLKHYRSSHRLLLTGTPLQNNLEELWALLNFLLPDIFNSSEDFSQWFNKPLQSNGDNSTDQALLSEEENLLIINRLHQVLRPFVLRRLKHKVENELPEKIERLVRCEASAYQKLLMKRVEDNLGSIGNAKSRSVHNSVMELRNICNHPYLSQLHAEEVNSLLPKHFLPSTIRLCGKLEMLDRLLPKLKAADHRVLFFSTMTRLLDVVEDYLVWKEYRYLRLDGHTSGGDRGGLIDQFNKPDSPFFIFLLSIRAGGVGVNLQAADTVIIFDTDWNPQVDLQAQARAHRIGQKREVLVLRFETAHSVEEQVRAAAEHKLGLANQSITAGFFDNNTSAADRREYLEALLRESKKEEDARVLDDDSLNYLIARSESEIDIFESIDKKRQEEEMAIWMKLVAEQGMDSSSSLPQLPSRLVTYNDLKSFYEVMKLNDEPKSRAGSDGDPERRGGGLDTQRYGRGKRAREVRSYEERWSEEEFEKLCQAEAPESSDLKDIVKQSDLLTDASVSKVVVGSSEAVAQSILPPQLTPVEFVQQQQIQEVTPPTKRGRGRPRRVPIVPAVPSGTGIGNIGSQVGANTKSLMTLGADSTTSSVKSETLCHTSSGLATTLHPNTSLSATGTQSTPMIPSVPMQSKGRGRKLQTEGQAPRPRGRKRASAMEATMNEQLQKQTPNAPGCQSINTDPCSVFTPALSGVSVGQISESDIRSQDKSADPLGAAKIIQEQKSAINLPRASGAMDKSSAELSDAECKQIAVIKTATTMPGPATGDVSNVASTTHTAEQKLDPTFQTPLNYNCVAPAPHLITSCPPQSIPARRPGRKTTNRAEATRPRGRKQAPVLPPPADGSSGQENNLNDPLEGKNIGLAGMQETDLRESITQDPKRKKPSGLPSSSRIPAADVNDVARVMKEIFSSETCFSKTAFEESSVTENRNTVSSTVNINFPIVSSASESSASETINVANVTPHTQNSDDKICSNMLPSGSVNKHRNKPIGTSVCQIDVLRVQDAPPGFGNLVHPDVGSLDVPRKFTNSDSTESLEYVETKKTEASSIESLNASPLDTVILEADRQTPSNPAASVRTNSPDTKVVTPGSSIEALPKESLSLCPDVKDSKGSIYPTKDTGEPKGSLEKEDRSAVSHIGENLVENISPTIVLALSSSQKEEEAVSQPDKLVPEIVSEELVMPLHSSLEHEKIDQSKAAVIKGQVGCSASLYESKKSEDKLGGGDDLTVEDTSTIPSPLSSSATEEKRVPESADLELKNASDELLPSSSAGDGTIKRSLVIEGHAEEIKAVDKSKGSKDELGDRADLLDLENAKANAFLLSSSVTEEKNVPQPEIESGERKHVHSTDIASKKSDLEKTPVDERVGSESLDTQAAEVLPSVITKDEKTEIEGKANDPLNAPEDGC